MLLYSLSKSGRSVHLTKRQHIFRGDSLVSKMTLSLELNSPATFFHQAWKSAVEVMTLPPLLEMVSSALSSLSCSSCSSKSSRSDHVLSAIVVGVKDGVGTALGDGVDGLLDGVD